MSALPDTEALAKLVADATPGPWRQDGIAISHPSPPHGYPVDVCLMGEPAQYAGDVPAMMENHEANAALIAIAPALAARATADAARIAELEAALKPFADFASARGFDKLPDNAPMTPGSRMAHRQVTAGDFKAAARATKRPAAAGWDDKAIDALDAENRREPNVDAATLALFMQKPSWEGSR